MFRVARLLSCGLRKCASADSNTNNRLANASPVGHGGYLPGILRGGADSPWPAALFGGCHLQGFHDREYSRQLTLFLADYRGGEEDSGEARGHCEATRGQFFRLRKCGQ